MQSTRRKRINRQKSPTAQRFARANKEIKAKRKLRFSPPVKNAPIYWPDHIDEVRAIAMTGMTDEEMAIALGVKPELWESWKQYYPSFMEAIDEGRTRADAQVVKALFNNAVGFDYDAEEVVKTRHGGEIVSVTKRSLPDTNAQKFWLTNRSSQWRQSQNLNVGGQRDGKPADAISVETKQQVIHSILNLITPRPDGDGRAPRIADRTSLEERIIENGR